MRAARYLTLVWPGLPWLWLRGSLPGLVVALGFAVTLDIAVLTTWIWSDVVDQPARLALWSAVAVIWALATASAVSAFPPALLGGRDAESDALYLRQPAPPILILCKPYANSPETVRSRPRSVTLSRARNPGF